MSNFNNIKCKLNVKCLLLLEYYLQKKIYLFLINVLLLESAKISNFVILNNVNMYKLNLNNIF